MPRNKLADNNKTQPAIVDQRKYIASVGHVAPCQANMVAYVMHGFGDHQDSLEKLDKYPRE